MREIEGLEEALERLQPHWPELETHFHEQNGRFIELMARDHDPIGRVLKCHLVVEQYLDQFLMAHYGLSSLRDAKLTFFQKATLLPDRGSAASLVRPGILRLNSIRNRFGHTLQPEIAEEPLPGIDDALRISRPGTQFPDIVARIEAFAAVACAFLMVTPPHLQQVFVEAFAHVRSRPVMPSDL